MPPGHGGRGRERGPTSPSSSPWRGDGGRGRGRGGGRGRDGGRGFHGGGGGPSPLHAVGRSTHDPRVLKASAVARTAKRVNTYRKLKARLLAEGGALALPPAVAAVLKDEEEGAGAGAGPATSALPPPPQPLPQPPPYKAKKPHNALAKLAETVAEQKAAAAAERTARAAAAAAAAAATAARDAARRKQGALLRKRTAKGQPIMKYRISGLLDKLMQSTAAPGSQHHH